MGMAETVFYDNGGVYVSDAVLRIGESDTFIVRNISSVHIRQQGIGWLMKLSIFFVLVGIFNWYTSAGSYLVMLFISLVLYSVYHYTREIVIVISAGGIEQQAISFPYSKTHVREAETIRSAITNAIQHLQSVGDMSHPISEARG